MGAMVPSESSVHRSRFERGIAVPEVRFWIGFVQKFGPKWVADGWLNASGKCRVNIMAVSIWHESVK